MNLDTVYHQNPDVVARKVSDEFILVPLSDDIADMDSIYTMNEVGAFIWENINGERTINEIINEVLSNFDVTPDEAKNDVIVFFEDIKIFLKENV
ncbi:PqqD family protein [Bacteroidota bacterium]